MGTPSTTATIQPQLSTLPPTATTFPPSVLPPVNSLQPYRTTGGLGYPSTIGSQYGLGAAGSATGALLTSVSTSSQLVSPWFPSLPATYCGGTFLLTIEGTPRGNGDNDNKIEPSDNNDEKTITVGAITMMMATITRIRRIASAKGDCYRYK